MKLIYYYLDNFIRYLRTTDMLYYAAKGLDMESSLRTTL